MELDVMKRLIKKYISGHADYVAKCNVAERYYLNKTDILYQEKKEDENGNPMRNADNRIPRNFHGLIVNQKSAYAFTAPPLFDVGTKVSNEKIAETLGDEYKKNCMELCVNAANFRTGWIHYWKGEAGFEWAVVDSREIIPVMSKNLKKKLMGVFRTYEDIDEETGDRYVIYEYWTDTECQAFRRKTSDTLEDGLCYYEMFADPEGTGEMVSQYRHDMGAVPFIPFQNNNVGTDDLVNIKPLIDVYDKVYSGFINDLEDIQELIFVLTGYGAEETNGFLQQLKKYKVIKLDPEEGADAKTLSIEIPVEAREKVLEATRKAIFEQGQGFDPQPESFGNQSGEALKFMYSLLEMKVGLMQVEFELGFAKLVRAICNFHGLECKKIIQTWTRTSIKNDTELATICQMSDGIVSRLTILKNHPLVEDAEQELKQLEKEEQEAQEKEQLYPGSFKQRTPGGGKEGNVKDGEEE